MKVNSPGYCAQNDTYNARCRSVPLPRCSRDACLTGSEGYSHQYTYRQHQEDLVDLCSYIVIQCRDMGSIVDWSSEAITLLREALDGARDLRGRIQGVRQRIDRVRRHRSYSALRQRVLRRNRVSA